MPRCTAALSAGLDLPSQPSTRYVVSLNGERRRLNSGSDRPGGSSRSRTSDRDGFGRAQRGHVTSKILLTGGCVLTLGAKTPNFTRADVLIDDGLVAEIGPGLRARDAELVDASDTIVLPGFVDTHRHA